jgi:hypothetical protein
VRKSIYFEVRNKTAGITLVATTDYMNEAIAKIASHVIQKAGAECLPFLVARLRVKSTSRYAITVRRLAYKLRLVDSVPTIGSYSDVQRGQAVTAILLVGGRVPPPFPGNVTQLSDTSYAGRATPIIPDLVILASDKRSEVSRAASYALREIAPEDFRKLNSSQQPSGN